MEYILASSNAHKAEELNNLLAQTSIQVIPSPSKIDVIEDGNTFQENAYKKAKEYSIQFNGPTVADDSGLVVPALPEILGIYSARFAPEYNDYKDKMNELLKVMSDLKEDERKAYFICYLCFYKSESEIFYFEGRVSGTIGFEQKGNDGFGYDPIFYPDGQDGKSLAELHEWKMKNSHRAKAAESAKKFFS